MLSAPSTVSERAPRLARLDGLRGVAALGVALYHMFYFIRGWPQAPLPIRWATDWLWASGWSLVDLFFLLSGTVFTQVYGAPGQLGTMAALRDFWIARVARLWPLHLVMLGFFAVFAWGEPAHDVPHFLAHLLMLQGFIAPVGRSFDDAAWSLSIELACYVIFCLAGWLGGRRGGWIVGLSWGVGLWWCAVVGRAGGPWVADALPRGLLGFFGGMLLWRNRRHVERVPTLIWGLLAMAGFWWQVGAYSPLVPLGLLVWPSLLMLALRFPLMEARAMVWLGERSYGIYLVNMGVIRALRSLVPVARLDPPMVLLLQCLALMLVLGLADVAYRLVETPARRVIRMQWLTLRQGHAVVRGQVA
jgi:peptidoglycan/LPS O-acetylase OafA/YrhL